MRPFPVAMLILRTPTIRTSFCCVPHYFRGIAVVPRSAKTSPGDDVIQQRRQPYRYQKPPPPKETWLANYLRKSPKAMLMFKGTTFALGAGGPRQVAGRRTHHIYETSCVMREEEEADFWHESCRLPQTFQSWFTITNLHIWLLTVRFRALPPPHGNYYVQTLVDNFFLDVEERVRQNLPTRAPERLTSRTLKIVREQWAGLGLSLDYALGLSSPYITAAAHRGGDVELAAIIWRNFLGARGAHGIDDPGAGTIRRSINVSGEADAVKFSKKEEPEAKLQQLEHIDDLSGVHDFTGDDTLIYLQYPELIYTIMHYIRRELVRLEGVSDEEIMSGNGTGRFGPIRT